MLSRVCGWSHPPPPHCSFLCYKSEIGPLSRLVVVVLRCVGVLVSATCVVGRRLV